MLLRVFLQITQMKYCGKGPIGSLSGLVITKGLRMFGQVKFKEKDCPQQILASPDFSVLLSVVTAKLQK